MKRVFCFVIIIISLTSFAQEETSIKDMFWDAESYFYEKDYKEALMIYQNIYNADYQNNANINYRIGVCHKKFKNVYGVQFHPELFKGL